SVGCEDLAPTYKNPACDAEARQKNVRDPSHTSLGMGVAERRPMRSALFTTRFALFSFGVLLLLLAPGCLSNVVQGYDEGDQALIYMLEAHVYRGPDFVKVNSAPYASGLNPANNINVYVDVADAKAYSEFTPEVDHKNLTFPIGGTIVREVV